LEAVKATGITMQYEKKRVIEDLDIVLPLGKITALIGPNGSCKSTLLKGVTRYLKPVAGEFFVKEKLVQEYDPKEMAKLVAMLPQNPLAPSDITVLDLVKYGRFPHQNTFGRFTKEDQMQVDWALKETELEELKNEPVESLSGGQRQRVWIAMTLAQNSDILLLDEPTTFLDLAHQLDILKLLTRLNKEMGKTIIMVIHDLNMAARFADYMVCLSDGKLLYQGETADVFTHEMLVDVFQIDAEITTDKRTGKPMMLSYDTM